MEIILESIIAQSKNQVSTDFEGEIVLMSIEQGRYYSLNGVLSRIWTLAEKPVKISTICNSLMDEYEVEQEECEKQTLEAVQALSLEKLIDVIAPSPA